MSLMKFEETSRIIRVEIVGDIYNAIECMAFSADKSTLRRVGVCDRIRLVAKCSLQFHSTGQSDGVMQKPLMNLVVSM